MVFFINGANALACWVVGLFFLRFARETRDRFFLAFAVAFWLWSLEWTVRVLAPVPTGHVPYVYLVRLAAFLLLIAAIIDKNRRR